MTRLVTFAFCWFMSSAAAVAETAAVEVVVKGLRSDRGSIGATLFAERNKGDFPGAAASAQASYYRRIETPGATVFVFKDVPYGSFAMALIHDEDGDHKVKMTLGIPREGVGFSNNPKIFFGPPGFDRASFRVDQERVRVEVEMKYLL